MQLVELYKMVYSTSQSKVCFFSKLKCKVEIFFTNFSKNIFLMCVYGLQRPYTKTNPTMGTTIYLKRVKTISAQLNFSNTTFCALHNGISFVIQLKTFVF